MRATTAVIPAAGLGTRFLPATKAVPKELLPIVDTPALQLIVDECVGAGFEHVVVVTSRAKPTIEQQLKYQKQATAWENWLKEAMKVAGVLYSAGFDPALVARELGLAGVTENSIDATASRDVVAEFAFIAAQLGIDLSRFAE
mgnify:CR=1 FL=1